MPAFNHPFGTGIIVPTDTNDAYALVVAASFDINHAGGSDSRLSQLKAAADEFAKQHNIDKDRVVIGQG